MDLEADGVSSLSVVWRRVLKEIDEELDSQEVAAMCFLCRDNLPGAKLEKISRGIELMTELESKGLMSSISSRFLTELLYRAGRLDLLKKLNHSYRTVQAEMHKSGSCFNPFRLLLQYFCNEMSNDEVQSMRFLAGSYVAKNKLQDVTTAQELFVVLEKAQIITSEDVMVLMEMTRSFDRKDLLDKIIEYEAMKSGVPLPVGVGPVPFINPVMGGPPNHLPGMPVDKMSPPSMSMITVMSSYGDPPPPYTPPLTPKMEPNRQPAKVPPPPSVVQDITSDRSLTPPIDSGPNKAQLAAELQREAEEMARMRQMQRLQEIRTTPQKPKIDINNIKKDSAALKKEFQKERKEQKLQEQRQKRASDKDEMPCYKMDAKPRGICVIINNKDFYQIMGDKESKNLPVREGTEIDCENLDYIWQKLNFHVEKFHNLSETEIMRTLAHYAFKVDHSHFDCFVCCILTHGMVGGIYGVNGRFLHIKDMTSCFKATHCPSLAGKPKMFFLQACQGRQKQQGIPKLEADAGDDLPPETIPNEADFLLGYATIPGYVSYRSRSMGSWYITKLVEMLDRYADKYDLLSILIKVNEEVSKAVATVEDQMYKQTPAPMPTLRKKIYFS